MQKNISKILKTLVWGDEGSLCVLDTTALVNEAISRHKLSAVAAAALGRCMTATAYLCSWLKGEDSTLSVSVNGNGAGGKIGVVGDGNLSLRGYIENPDLELPLRADGKLDVGACVGHTGVLSVIRDDGDGLPFTGTCELVSGEIAEDFSAYFLTSEQRPTAIALGVQIQRGKCIGAGGVFLQLLPNASEGALLRAEKEILYFNNISARVREEGIEAIARGLGAESWTKREIAFRCHCSRARAASAIVSLGRKEAEQVIEEEGKITVHCHYCNTDYSFQDGDVEKLFGEEEI